MSINIKLAVIPEQRETCIATRERERERERERYIATPSRLLVMIYIDHFYKSSRKT